MIIMALVTITKAQLRVVERIKNFYAEGLEAEQFFGAC